MIATRPEHAADEETIDGYRRIGTGVVDHADSPAALGEQLPYGLCLDVEGAHCLEREIVFASHERHEDPVPALARARAGRGPPRKAVWRNRRSQRSGCALLDQAGKMRQSSPLDQKIDYLKCRPIQTDHCCFHKYKKIKPQRHREHKDSFVSFVSLWFLILSQ